MDLDPITYMMKMFPDLKERDEVRKIIGRYGLTGKQQVPTNERTQTEPNRTEIAAALCDKLDQWLVPIFDAARST